MNRNLKCLGELDISFKYERVYSFRYNGSFQYNGLINSLYKYKNWFSVDDNVLILEVKKRDRLNDFFRRKLVRLMSEVFIDSRFVAFNFYGVRES